MHRYSKLLFILTTFSFFSVAFAQEQAILITYPSDTVQAIPTTHLSGTLHTTPISHPSVTTVVEPTHLTTDSLIRFAKRYLGKPYHYRPNPSIRFDCSGFSSYVYDHFGFKLKRSSAEQATQFGKIERTELKPGDLVFFSGRRVNKRVGHVGIVVNAHENGKFEFIHSSNQSGIVISRSDEHYYARRYISAGRVIDPSGTATQTDTTQVTPDRMPALASATPSEIQTAQPKTPTDVFHHVKKGDTLYSIARKHGVTVNTLKRHNNLTGDKIMPGQKLSINSFTSPR
ncbi:MAG: NlpC/P60 family protein [Paludibacter sp.]|jgi:cell wall-associated NlpC family hydrolase|nr:NlpC/P60 family protein [Paludibacter sp.]